MGNFGGQVRQLVQFEIEEPGEVLVLQILCESEPIYTINQSLATNAANKKV